MTTNSNTKSIQIRYRQRRCRVRLDVIETALGHKLDFYPERYERYLKKPKRNTKKVTLREDKFTRPPRRTHSLRTHIVNYILEKMFTQLAKHLTPAQLDAIIREYLTAYIWRALGNDTLRVMGKRYPRPLFKLEEVTNGKPVRESNTDYSLD